MQDFQEYFLSKHPVVNYILYYSLLMELYKDYFTLLRRIYTTCFHVQRNLYIAYKMH